MTQNADCWERKGIHAAAGPVLGQSLLPKQLFLPEPSSFETVLARSCCPLQFLRTWVPSRQLLVFSLPVTSVLAKLRTTQAQLVCWAWLMGPDVELCTVALEQPDSCTQLESFSQKALDSIAPRIFFSVLKTPSK